MDWNENWPFPVLWPLLNFPNLLAYWVQHFSSIIFRIWNSSTGINSCPLDLFIVMLPNAHLTLHSRMSGSRWVITPWWLSGSWRSLDTQYLAIFPVTFYSSFNFILFITSSMKIQLPKEWILYLTDIPNSSWLPIFSMLQ